MLEPDDLDLLESQRVARLATVDVAGRPYLVPVCFVALDGRLYIPIDAKPKRGEARALKRLRNLRERPEAVLLVDEYEEDWHRLRWLAVRAEAAILDVGDSGVADERERALTRLEDRYPQYAAMGLGTLGLPVIALTPTRVTRWRADGGGEPDGGQPDWSETDRS
jgi:PPOX class probable F420-dependent enzyme